MLNILLILFLHIISYNMIFSIYVFHAFIGCWISDAPVHHRCGTWQSTGFSSVKFSVLAPPWTKQLVNKMISSLKSQWFHCKKTVSGGQASRHAKKKCFTSFISLRETGSNSCSTPLCVRVVVCVCVPVASPRRGHEREPGGKPHRSVHLRHWHERQQTRVQKPGLQWLSGWRLQAR